MNYQAAYLTLRESVMAIRDGVLPFPPPDRTIREQLDDALNAATRAGDSGEATSPSPDAQPYEFTRTNVTLDELILDKKQRRLEARW